MAEHNEFGELGELIAADYLRRKNYVILDRNWRNWEGRELDIVALQDSTLVFVEVKTRRNELYGPATQAVDLRKMQHIASAARSYINYHRMKHPYRFDVITVVGQEPDVRIEHHEDYFDPHQLPASRH